MYLCWTYRVLRDKAQNALESLERMCVLRHMGANGRTNGEKGRNDLALLPMVASSLPEVELKSKGSAAVAEWIEAVCEGILRARLRLRVKRILAVVELFSLLCNTKSAVFARKKYDSTWIGKHLLGGGDVDELCLGLLFLLLIAEVVWVPLLRQLSVRFLYLSLVRVSAGQFHAC